MHGQNAHLVTLVDRKSRYTLIGKVDTKRAEIVADAMIKLLEHVSCVCTITLDNGGEFAAHERVSEAVNADVFFAKPYASYQPAIKEERIKIPMVLSDAPIQRKWHWVI